MVFFFFSFFVSIHKTRNKIWTRRRRWNKKANEGKRRRRKLRFGLSSRHNGGEQKFFLSLFSATKGPDGHTPWRLWPQESLSFFFATRFQSSAAKKDGLFVGPKAKKVFSKLPPLPSHPRMVAASFCEVLCVWPLQRPYLELFYFVSTFFTSIPRFFRVFVVKSKKNKWISESVFIEATTTYSFLYY